MNRAGCFALGVAVGAVLLNICHGLALHSYGHIFGTIVLASAGIVLTAIMDTWGSTW